MSMHFYDPIPICDFPELYCVGIKLSVSSIASYHIRMYYEKIQCQNAHPLTCNSTVGIIERNKEKSF